MTQYYIFAQEAVIDTIVDELSGLPAETITYVVVKDNSGVMPPRYIRVSTDVLTDVGLVEMIKQKTLVFNQKIRIVKELQSRIPLV